MQKEKIAAITLVIIIIGALTIYLTAMYYPKIFENLFQDEREIDFGDYADVHYVGHYASNDTIFESSYENPEAKSGGTPLNVFITLNTSAVPEQEFISYSNLIGENDNFVEGFIDGLEGLKQGQTATIGPLEPEKAYGVKPTIGQVINFSALGGGDIELTILKIEENAPMPPEFAQFYPDIETTTVYTLRDGSHYIGEVVDLYPSWENATKVTKINETLLWTYTTPPDDLPENFTWTDINLITGTQTAFPDSSSAITTTSNDTIVITHSPAINSSIVQTDLYGMSSSYTVESLSTDTINTSYILDQTTGNKSYQEFDRTTTIQRNKTENITYPFAAEYLELILSYLRGSDPSIKISTGPMADESVYFEVEIIKVYPAS
jgi:hypothetical protein